MRTPDMSIADPQGAADHWLRTADIDNDVMSSLNKVK